VGPRASLDDVKNRKFLHPPGLELRPLGRPDRKPVAIPTELSLKVVLIIGPFSCVS
jgi:hypothetical protein